MYTIRELQKDHCKMLTFCSSFVFVSNAADLDATLGLLESLVPCVNVAFQCFLGATPFS